MMPDTPRPAKLIVFHRGRVDILNSGDDECLEKIRWVERTMAKGALKNPSYGAIFCSGTSRVMG
jgi:hypothetical protein